MGGHRKVQQSTKHRRGQRGGRTTRRALLYGELQVLEAQRDRPLSAGKAVSRAGLTRPDTSMHLACLAECGLMMWECPHYRRPEGAGAGRRSRGRRR